MANDEANGPQSKEKDPDSSNWKPPGKVVITHKNTGKPVKQNER